MKTVALYTPRNELSLYRRHVKNCPISDKPVTFASTKKLKDACACPIVAGGYLELELEENGKQKRIRHLSLGTADWNEALKVQVELLERKRVGDDVQPIKPEEPAKPKHKTVQQAVERFLTMSAGNGTVEATQSKYVNHLMKRLLPFCAEHGITDIRHFESEDHCREYIESWRQNRRGTGEPLAKNTWGVELSRLKRFLNYAAKVEWIRRNGAKDIRWQGKKGDKRRYGLELEEYRWLLDVDCDQETRTAIELMRWTGMRVSDCHKFRYSELVPNLTGDGYNADFIQKKTGTQCISPVPPHVVKQLRALPKTTDGRFFISSYSALRYKVEKVIKAAQTKDRTFKHPVTIHCLRHTFAIQNLNHGVDIRLVSEWLGHESVSVTMDHYRNEIESTRRMSEQANREAVAKMLGAA